MNLNDATAKLSAWALATLVMVLAGCSGGSAPGNEIIESPDPPVDTNPVQITVVDQGFSAQYEEFPVRLPSAYSVSGMELPIDLANVDYVDSYELSQNQLDFLSVNGFVAVPAAYDEFFNSYHWCLNRDLPFFITTDSMLHVYHLLFAKILRDMEDQLFYPRLAAITSALEDNAKLQYLETVGTSLEAEALHTWAYFALAEQLVLQEPPSLDGTVAGLVEPDLENVLAHSAMTQSAVLTFNVEYLEDFSQYKPRGHYSRSEQRKRYFRTMMWYGRANLRLQSADETRMALLINRLSYSTQAADSAVTDLWSSIYDPTAFLVGNADDLGIREYGTIISDVYGENFTLAAIADDAKLTQFTAAARELPGPQINSMFVDPGADLDEVTQGFRFMGQRFVLDAYVFQELLNEKVSGRMMPNGLDVFAALGNDPAYQILEDLGETSYPNYDTQMTGLRTKIDALTLEDWSQSVYFNWLYMLEGLVQPKDNVYPPFMRTDAWAVKDIQAGLGSWAELKHDTILYAKQAMPVPTCGPSYDFLTHYVEPSPLAYSRMLSLIKLTKDGMANYEIPDPRVINSMDATTTLLEALLEIAELELEGTALSEQQASNLIGFPEWYEYLVVLCADSEYGGEPGDEPAALIADVATNPDSGEALEVATGPIYDIYVVTPDGNGDLQLSRGGIFSYYEFPWPASDRLTDEQWREMIKNGEQPDQPAWTEGFIK